MTRSEVGDYLDRFKLRRRHCEALERAGLPWVRFHDLRHALGTAAIAKLEPFAVQGYMGISTTRPRSATCTTSLGGRTFRREHKPSGYRGNGVPHRARQDRSIGIHGGEVELRVRRDHLVGRRCQSARVRIQAAHDLHVLLRRRPLSIALWG